MFSFILSFNVFSCLCFSAVKWLLRLYSVFFSFTPSALSRVFLCWDCCQFEPGDLSSSTALFLSFFSLLFFIFLLSSTSPSVREHFQSGETGSDYSKSRWGSLVRWQWRRRRSRGRREWDQVSHLQHSCLSASPPSLPPLLLTPATWRQSGWAGEENMQSTPLLPSSCCTTADK